MTIGTLETTNLQCCFLFLTITASVTRSRVCVCFKAKSRKTRKKLKILHFVYSKIPKNEACGLTQRNTMHVYGPGGLG